MTQSGIGEKGFIRTSETGFKVSITHLILPRAPSHVVERLMVFMASSAPRSATLVDEIAARSSPAGSIGVAGGESASELAGTPDRVVLDSWTMGGSVTSTDPGLSTSADLNPTALMDKAGL